jgi:hypothetical protein
MALARAVGIARPTRFRRKRDVSKVTRLRQDLREETAKRVSLLERTTRRPHLTAMLRWQRAGRWAELFAPSLGERSVLPQPQAIFASAPASGHDVGADGVGSRSRRLMETVSTLAGKLYVAVDLRFSKGQEVALVRVLSGIQGTTLVCWQHENIAAIASALSPRPAQFPHDWPPDRFNIVFRFVRDGGANAQWSFD